MIEKKRKKEKKEEQMLNDLYPPYLQDFFMVISPT